jgi:putative ABC transport system permease protein
VSLISALDRPRAISRSTSVSLGVRAPSATGGGGSGRGKHHRVAAPPSAALLGSGAAYLALAAGHRSDISVLSRVPVLDLAIILAGVPVAAALAGWVLAGRRPPVTRQALD